ncbi:unnamed protein product [Spirodela intermedia]|uniref:Uncharacterized protein n=1 Tax=Spirodela intermedia TaxID=51605 RepID=A0A7I8JIM3_SPIIN|nr:unnamed protein product [Spirodela intermedia]CAA6669996.1 unnamed protein product [Spirodela intermedia]
MGEICGVHGVPAGAILLVLFSAIAEGIFRLRLSLRSEATRLGFQNQPHLAADAAACGWSRFVFLDRDEPPTRRGSLLSSCVACEVGRSNPAAAADCEMPCPTNFHVFGG